MTDKPKDEHTSAWGSFSQRRIDIRKKQDRLHWSQIWGVRPLDIVIAVENVGDAPEDVERELKKS